MSVTGRLEAYLGERFSPHTKRAFLGHARAFVAAVGLKESYGRDDVLAFVDHLIRGGYKEHSIRTILVGVRTFFVAEGWSWPVVARDLRLGLPQEEPNAPALLPDEIRLLIRAVRGQMGFPATVVCLAAIYGLRGDEISRTLGAGCDGRTLVVQTAKGGRKRSHLVPGLLLPYLRFPPLPVSTRRLHAEFERLMLGFVRPPLPREGWHALRRTLVTALYAADVKTYDVHRWFGWRELKDITYRYYRPAPELLDKTIYDAHPFLRAFKVEEEMGGGARIGNAAP